MVDAVEYCRQVARVIGDIVSDRGSSIDKTVRVFPEFRCMIGGDLFNLPVGPWLPRRRTLQPVCTEARR